MTLRFAIGSLLLVGAVAGCTRLGPYRTHTIVSGPTGLTYAVADCTAGRSGDKACERDVEGGPGTYAIQRREYRYQSRDGAMRTGVYHMAFVEFDDQGWFHDRRQMEALFMLLQRLEENQRHVLLLVYVHGWKHNASACDDNVVCFSRLVERMDILERHLEDAGSSDAPERHVVGVYVGWRGLSLRFPKNMTFWTRKDTAARVGRGGVKELLTRLNDYRRARNPLRDETKTQLAIAGHSFGGLVVYSALSHALTERAVEVVRTGDVNRYATAASFGDLVVLVNPAFEGSLYEPLYNVAVNRCYPSVQRPALMVVTSEGDDATGVAFPLGRRINTLFESAASKEQGRSARQTVGHDPRYETHRLEWRDPEQAKQRSSKQEERAPQDRECGCPYLDPTETFKWWQFAYPIPLVARPKTATERERWTPPPVSAVVRDGRRQYDVYGDDVMLTGDLRYSANYPYLVVKTDAKIIADHNAIYSEPFVRFVHAFFLLHIANRRPFEADRCYRDFENCRPGSGIPCERSCQLANGNPCTFHHTPTPRE